jgi:hypothetical protein
MAYGLIITETATAVVAKMDPETHDRFVHAMLELTTDPHSQGQAIGNDGPAVTERAMALGASGLIVYVVDDVAATVRIVNVIWID